NASAWCGLRAHGDITYTDAITGNPFNAMLLEFNGESGGGAGSGVGTSKKFPGYPGQMDQMLYRDIQITAATATLNLTFLYKTRMSTGVPSTASTRTGWFQFDPTVVGPVAVAGPNAGISNYISNSGGGQPADSFMVYIGVPVNDASIQLANGSTKPVFDAKRRWFSEVVALDKPLTELLHAAGDNNTSFTQNNIPLAAFYNAHSGGSRFLRVVFRTKTNRNFDDLTGSQTGTYSSGGEGAVLIDNVGINGTAISGGAVGTSNFEATTDINNGTTALAAWRSTG